MRLRQLEFEHRDVRPERCVMAGDSMRSDIRPALEAGAWAAYIPQPFAWSHEAAAAPLDAARFRELASLAELPAWIDAIDEELGAIA